MTFLRLLWPEAIVTEDRGTFKSFAKKSMQASLALPSTGGAVKDNFSASATTPATAFFLARGCTLTANVTPSADSCKGIKINSSMFPLHFAFNQNTRCLLFVNQ
jgi:hypothetical protein